MQVCGSDSAFAYQNVIPVSPNVVRSESIFSGNPVGDMSNKFPWSVTKLVIPNPVRKPVRKPTKNELVPVNIKNAIIAAEKHKKAKDYCLYYYNILRSNNMLKEHAEYTVCDIFNNSVTNPVEREKFRMYLLRTFRN